MRQNCLSILAAVSSRVFYSDVFHSCVFSVPLKLAALCGCDEDVVTLFQASLDNDAFSTTAISVVRIVQQESLANAKVNARQHCVSLSCLCNSLTQIEWVVQLLLPPKHAKSREIQRKFKITAVPGHSRSPISM